MPPLYYHASPQQPQHPQHQQQHQHGPQPHLLPAHSYPANQNNPWPNPPSLPSLGVNQAANASVAPTSGIPTPANSSTPAAQRFAPHHPPSQPPASAPPNASPAYNSDNSSSAFAPYSSDLHHTVAPVYPLPNQPEDAASQDVEDMLQIDAASPLPTPLPDPRPSYVNASLHASLPEPSHVPKHTKTNSITHNKQLHQQTQQSDHQVKDLNPRLSNSIPRLSPMDHSSPDPSNDPAAFAAPDLLTTTVPASFPSNPSFRKARPSTDAQPFAPPLNTPVSPSKPPSANKPPAKPGKSARKPPVPNDTPSTSTKESMHASHSNSSLGTKQPKLSAAAMAQTPPALPSAMVSPTRFASPESAAEPPSELDLNVSPADDQSALVSSTEPLSFGGPAHAVIDFTLLEVDFDNVKNRIGVGTYGAVYIGRFCGELVAIKRIHVPKPASAVAQNDPFVAERQRDAIHQFAREIRRYERISHPGIVRFLGVTLPPDSSALLVTELMHGGSLGGAISDLRRAKRPFNRSAVVRIAMQACAGLRALHQAKCTWGDAKPENILLSEHVDAQGMFPLHAEARIADFGLSRSVGQTLLADTTLAGSGQPAGTYNYMAPESYSGVDRSNPEEAKASDIYSFGMVIFEMLTLRTPFRRRKLMEVFHAVLEGERPEWPVESDRDFLEPVPVDLKNLVESCWAQEPESRPNADQVFNLLEKISNDFCKSSGHRQVLEIVSDPDTSDATGCPEMAAGDHIQTMGSRQSSVSTAIAIGDGSVDFGGLNSTRESQRIPDGSDDDEDDGGSMIAPAPPRMSPITSPEPRFDERAEEPSGNDASPHKNLRKRAEKQKLESALPQVEPQKKAGATGSKPMQHNLAQFLNSNGAQKTILAAPGEGMSLFDHGTRFEASQQSTTIAEDGSALGQQDNSQQDLALLKTTEFIKHRDEIALATATAASKIQRADNEQLDGSDAGLSGSISNPVMIPTSSNGLDISTADLSSSNNSSTTASLRRKRRNRLQSIIEHAALALIEIQRRDENLNKTPPKQRKEAAERKAQENARMRSERDALKTIDVAKKQGDFSVVLDEMRTHRHSQPVIKVSTTVLEQYCKDESYYLDICEEGGVEELVSAAALHGIQDEQLSVLFCDCIKALSEHYDHKVSHLVRAVGAPSAVVELLQHHKTAVKVQIAGCECLAVIASSSELSRSAVATLGGPAAVYQAMTKNNNSFKDVELARAALRAIRHIALDNERAAEYLVQVAALDTVVRAADTFTTHGLEGDILDALRAFSFYDGGRRNVIMSSGLKALTAIMVRNQEPDFSVQCCTFIREIARWRDHECEQNMLQSSISERITALMKTSNDIPGEEGARVAWYASHACTFLASFGSQSRQRLRQVGAIEMAIMILRKRVENARVVHSATDALAELIRNEPESKAKAEQLNVSGVLMEALKTHGDIARVKNALQWTLDYMTSTSKSTGPLGNGGGHNGGKATSGPGVASGATTQTDSRVVNEIEQVHQNSGHVMPAPEPRQKRDIFRRLWQRNK